MNRKTGAPVGCRIEGLEQQRLVHLHLGEVVPALSGIVQGDLQFSSAIPGSTFDRNQVFATDRRGVAQYQRVVENRPGDLTPDVDDGEAPLQQFFRFIEVIREVVTQSLDAGSSRVIVMHDIRRLANTLFSLSLKRS